MAQYPADLHSSLRTAIFDKDVSTIDAMAEDAARSGNVPILCSALQSGLIKPDKYITQALSVKDGFPDAYACLLDFGLDINAPQHGHMGNALIAASKYGQVDIIRMLLSRGADPNPKDVAMGGPGRHGPLACAAECLKSTEGTEAVKVLLEAGAEINGSGALQQAARWGEFGEGQSIGRGGWSGC